MAASYDPSLAAAKDRVRRMIADKAAPWRFEDEEIAYELTRVGFVGDPLAALAEQPTFELEAAIVLMESEPDTSGAINTVKQGSVVRTNQLGLGGRTEILYNLRRRLALLYGQVTDNGGPVVVDGFTQEFPPCRSIGFGCRIP